MIGKKWIIASIGSLGVLLLVGGVWWLIATFYHPLTLIHVIDRQNVIGYIEWRNQDQAQLLEGDSVPLPDLMHKLNCTTTTCPFSGKNNALVLRKVNSEPVWEYYISQPNKTIVQANWESLTQGQNELLVNQDRYRLYWNDDLAILSPRNNPTTAITVVDQMPWTTDKSWSAWGSFLAVGYCDRECLWSNWQSVGPEFPLLTDFITDTIDYSTFVIKSSITGPQFSYQLNYTASYHASNSEKDNITSVEIPTGATLVFSGKNLSTTISDILHDTQNKGLWKTIIDFGSQTPTGLLLETISKVITPTSYTIAVGNNWQNTTIQLSLSEPEWVKMQATIIEQAKLVVPTLFPRKEILVLPDSSSGYEWVKNNSLNYLWTPATMGKSELVISDSRNGAVVVKVYTLYNDDKVTLSMSPITATKLQTCSFNRDYQEFSAWHTSHQYWLWSGITKRSLSSEQGIIGWQKSIPGCVQN